MKKPDRAHHCRQCEQCVLKMDHHCNWIANCVGFFNYKYFLCMLIYSVLCIGIIIGSFWETVIVVLNDERNSAVTCLFIVLYYSILVMKFIVLIMFTSFHFWLIKKNYSTIEYCEKKKRHANLFSTSPYHRGVFKNFQQTLGTNYLFWFIPTRFGSICDGVSFIK